MNDVINELSVPGVLEAVENKPALFKRLVDAVDWSVFAPSRDLARLQLVVRLGELILDENTDPNQAAVDGYKTVWQMQQEMMQANVEQMDRLGKFLESKWGTRHNIPEPKTNVNPSGLPIPEPEPV